MAQYSRTFRIFVSSTFSDLKAERNALQEKVFPRLRDLAAAHSCRFQAIDLRWGVSEEAALDQQTMKICLGEIERCQNISPRPNFIVLLGDRYGWRPIPFEIPADEFEKFLTQVADGERSLLEQWYCRDDNAIPPTYCLRPRIGEFVDYEAWEKVESGLRRTFLSVIEKLAFSPEAALKYTASATEQEIVAGALKVQDANQHVFCFLRDIQGLPEDGSAASFREADPDAARMQAELKEHLKQQLLGNVHEYKAHWLGDGPSLEHLDQFCEDVYTELSKVILSEVGLLETVDLLEKEISAHEAFGKDRARIFVGRAEILKAIEAYTSGYNPHPLAIWGASGSGKSALMAKAVEHAQKNSKDRVYRFIGATPESSSGRALLESLCRQISRIYGADETTIPSEYKDLSREFPKRLALATLEKPLILFLDALDQLFDADNDRNLTWLPANLPSNVHLIISTLPGESLKALEVKLPEQNRLEVQPISVEDGKAILSAWFKETYRKLQDDQEQVLMSKFKECGLPLYLKLAFEEARLWKSYDAVPELSGDIPGILRDLFKRLSQESNHGSILVSRSLGYLASGKNGLSEDELLDVLSMDTEVLADFQRRSPKSPKVEHLPVVVWSRLYFDLEPYLTERSADGTSLLVCYHRQLGEAINAEYLSGENKPNRHEILAKYFSEQQLQKDYSSDKSPNLRMLSEQPYQQAKAGLSKEFVGTLTNFNFLQTKVTVLGPQPMIEDYDLISQFPASLGEGKALRLIQGALRLSAPILATRPDRLAGQLTGRLVVSPGLEIGHLLDSIRAGAPRPWLCPLTLALTQSGGPLEQVLLGHTGWVNAVAVTPDGTRIVSGADDCTLRVWDLESGEVERTLEGHAGRVSTVAVTPDGRRVISGACHYWDHTVRVWDLASGRLERTLEGNTGCVEAVAVTPDGSWVISGGEDENIFVWNLTSGRLERTIALYPDSIKPESSPEALINAIAVTTDGKRIISGGRDHIVRVWDLASGRLEHTLEGHTGTVYAVAVTPDGARIVSGSGDCTLRVWDLVSGRLERTLEGHTDAVIAVAVTPDSSHVVSGGQKTTIVRVWDLASGQPESPLEGQAGRVNAVAVMPDGKRIVSSLVSNVRVWNLASYRPERTLEGHADSVMAVAVTPDGSRIVSAGGPDDCKLKVWNLASGQLERTLEGHSSWPSSVAITPDGSRIVSGANDRTVRVWNLASGQLEQTLVGHAGAVSGVVVTPDGRRIVSGGWGDKTVRVWDLASGRLEHVFTGHTDLISAVAVTPDGSRIVSCGHDATVRVWILATGQLERILIGHTNPVYELAITPDGTRVISGGHDGTVRVWNLASGKLERTYQSHTDSVSALAITVDGSRIFSGGNDGMRVRDLASGQEITSWVTDPNNYAKAFCTVPTDRSLIVYGDSDGHIQVLRLLE